VLSKAEVHNLRQDFPALQQVHPKNGKPPIYLDNSCVTLQTESVARAIFDYGTKYPGCGGHRSKHWFAAATEEKLEEGRRAMTALFMVPSARGIEGETYPLIFTRNTTEGLNLVANRLGLMVDDTVVITNKEHNSNLCPWQEFERRGGRVRFVSCGEDNSFDPKDFISLIEQDRSVKVLALHHSSNLDGVTVPLTDIVAGVRAVERAQKRNIFIVVDGAQAAPHLPVNLGSPGAPGYLDVDFYAGSLHKMMGPSGMGFLFSKPEFLDCMNPFLVGGSTIFETSAYHHPVYAEWPDRFEAGLQNYGGIHGAGAAARYLAPLIHRIRPHEVALNQCMTEILLPLHQAERLRIVGPVDPNKRGGVLTFIVPEAPDGPRFQRFEDRAADENLMYRAGQFCVDVWFSTRRPQLPKKYTAVRLSAYIYNTLEEVELAANIVKEVFS
jgi:cysteine desulfurase / selenocysteine lyase